jgi:TPR repeat protein
MIRAGTIFFTGPKELYDPQLAYNYIYNAANLESGDAMNMLGQLLQMELGLEDIQTPNHVDAMEWYTKAMKLGCVPAIHNLGLMYEQGKGVEIDLKKAIRLFEQVYLLVFNV